MWRKYKTQPLNTSDLVKTPEEKLRSKQTRRGFQEIRISENCSLWKLFSKILVSYIVTITKAICRDVTPLHCSICLHLHSYSVIKWLSLLWTRHMLLLHWAKSFKDLALSRLSWIDSGFLRHKSELSWLLKMFESSCTEARAWVVWRGDRWM